MTTTTTTAKKTSLAKQALWTAILNGTLLLVNVIRFLLSKSFLTVTADNYATIIPIRQAIGGACIVLLIVVLIFMAKQTTNPEKEDELAKLHRYKAGYISFYVFLFFVIFLIYSVKNFETAFVGDFLDNANVAFMLFAFSQCLYNIVFIYLEKHSLE